jgi:hypothetical protein
MRYQNFVLRFMEPVDLFKILLLLLYLLTVMIDGGVNIVS